MSQTDKNVIFVDELIDFVITDPETVEILISIALNGYFDGVHMIVKKSYAFEQALLSLLYF